MHERIGLPGPRKDLLRVLVLRAESHLLKILPLCCRYARSKRGRRSSLLSTSEDVSAAAAQRGY